MSASHAVLFKTHFWNAFAPRHLERLTRVRCGDIYIFIDETYGVAARSTIARIA